MAKGLKEIKPVKTLDPQLDKFLNDFGMEKILYGKDYLYNILLQHFEGYEFDKMADDEFKHVGGVILLNLN